MNVRLAWFAALSLFAAAAALIAAGHPMVAAVLLMGVSYLAGRSDRRRDRRVAQAEVVRLQDERDRALAEADRAGTELIYHHNQRHMAMFGDDSHLLPDLRDRPDWASIDRKPDVTASHVPVSERTTISNP